MSQMKFINHPESCVISMLKGLSQVNRNLLVDEESKLVFYKQRSNNVKILSGGGSGHEPFCAGFVGDGMLSGAVAGDIFTSPATSNILHAIKTLSLNNNNNGVFIVILNYTGDTLNFGLAIEQAKLQNIQIESVVVDEDCSKFGHGDFIRRRRGMSGSIFVLKVAGALAKMGVGLADIKNTCQQVISKIGSLGMCVASSTVPGVGVLFEISSQDMEMGVGIHGEAGIYRCKLSTVDKFIPEMLKKIMECLKIRLEDKCKLCVLINNLGSVSQLEMYVISDEICKFFRNSNIELSRIYVGTFMTSLDMVGVQICLLDVTANLHWMEYLDFDTDALAWPKLINLVPTDIVTYSKEEARFHSDDYNIGIKFDNTQSALLKNCLRVCAENLIASKDQLNELDKTVGDGDTGTTLCHLAEAVLANLDSFKLTYPASCFKQLSEIAEIKMGGTSGALYSLLFTGASDYFKNSSSLSWYLVYQSAINSVLKYSTATYGDRTMLDVLLPVLEEHKKLLTDDTNEKQAFVTAVSHARDFLKATRDMTPKVGRASYVSSDYVKAEDAGALAITVILESIATEIQRN